MAKEAAAALDATDKDVSIGGAGLAAGAIELGLVDELHIFRNPVVVGGGTAFLPPVTRDSSLVDATGVTPPTPDHASTSWPTMGPTGSTLQITRRDCRSRGQSRRFR